MSRWYQLLYGVGLTPWESDYSLVPQLEGLLASEEADRDIPYGPAARSAVTSECVSALVPAGA